MASDLSQGIRYIQNTYAVSDGECYFVDHELPSYGVLVEDCCEIQILINPEFMAVNVRLTFPIPEGVNLDDILDFFTHSANNYIDFSLHSVYDEPPMIGTKVSVTKFEYTQDFEESGLLKLQLSADRANINIGGQYDNNFFIRRQIPVASNN